MDEIKKSLDSYDKQLREEIKNQQKKQKEQQARLAIHPISVCKSKSLISKTDKNLKIVKAKTN